MEKQIMSIFAGINGYLDNLEISLISFYEKGLFYFMVNLRWKLVIDNLKILYDLGSLKQEKDLFFSCLSTFIQDYEDFVVSRKNKVFFIEQRESKGLEFLQYNFFSNSKI